MFLDSTPKKVSSSQSFRTLHPADKCEAINVRKRGRFIDFFTARSLFLVTFKPQASSKQETQLTFDPNT